MKYIKNHLMFILPLMAILLGIEFFLVFDRITKSYEEGLKDGYSMLVVTKKPATLNEFKTLNKHVNNIEIIERKNIVEEIVKDVSQGTYKEILTALPYFYNIGLDAYLSTANLKKTKQDLEKDINVKKVETFGNSYSSAYKLYSFIKFTLKLFIGFMSIVSIFLIIKQMEIWKYAHKERMQVMEIFGAPLMLRSGILFKAAILDSFIATVLTSLFFIYIKLQWAANSGIDIMMKKQEELFIVNDIAILLGAALLIVIIAVYSVVFSSKGVQE